MLEFLTGIWAISWPFAKHRKPSEAATNVEVATEESLFRGLLVFGKIYRSYIFGEAILQLIFYKTGFLSTAH